MTRRKLIGEDYNGTKYYEDPEARSQRGRSFEPREENQFDVELPAEWEAWLRYRRREPPTEDEVKANYEMMMLKKKNAAELEEKYRAEKGTSLAYPKPKSGMESFPTYDEYKNYGQDLSSEQGEKREPR
uniref:Mimitin, mitochondrial n=1 Tax=Bracon brevicornis TaxID=1563983 RepID=A0A6V7LWE1_9HYME